MIASEAFIIALGKLEVAEDRIKKLEADLEKAEHNAWREAVEIARGTNADMCNTARRAYQVICGAINDAANNPELRTLQGRVKALTKEREAEAEYAAYKEKWDKMQPRIEELVKQSGGEGTDDDT